MHFDTVLWEKKYPPPVSHNICRAEYFFLCDLAIYLFYYVCRKQMVRYHQCGKGDLFLYITYLNSSVSVSRRKVLSFLFWMPRHSLNWAELRSLSISHTGPTVCLTRWARCAAVCSSAVNCWNWTGNQPQKRISLLMSSPVKSLSCKRKKKRNKNWRKNLKKLQTHAICLCLFDRKRCMSSLCAATTVRKMAIFWRLTRQKAQHGVSTLKFVLCVFLCALVR